MSTNRTLDIAVFTEDVKSSPVEFEGHVVDLSAVAMTEEEFRALFYASNNNEAFMLNCSDTASKANITFNELFYETTNTGELQRFNLINEVVSKYSDDLKVLVDCFEPCSLIEIQKQLSKVKTLCDICDIKCSLTWSEVYASLISLGATMVDEIHRLRVNALFTNSNPSVQDIMIRFNYDVTLPAL